MRLRSLGLPLFRALVGTVAVWCMQCCITAGAGPHDAFLGGPWEITVRIGLDGHTLHFPISVANESKAQPLEQILPVMGTPVKLYFEHYVPDLGWELRCVKTPESGHAARLRIKGEQLDQTLWLQSRDKDRRIISSPIGGIEMKELLGTNPSAEFFQELTNPATVGVLSFWGPQQDIPIELGVQPGKTVTLPHDLGILSVIEYMPHYSVDRASKAVINLSDQPVNPAVKLGLKQDAQAHERWVWARFSAYPHETPVFPLRVEFSNYYLGQTDGKYLLVVGRDMQARLLFYRDGLPLVEPVKPGHSYAFSRKGYSFCVEEIIPDAVIKNVWKNRSDRLIRPALIGTLDSGRIKKQVVLEFNKPYHYKTESGTLVLIYRQRTQPPGKQP